MFNARAFKKLNMQVAVHLHIIAIVMLVLAGGSFTHASEISHTHANITAEVKDDHSHIKSNDDGLKFSDQSTIHCGSNICLLREETYHKSRTVSFEKIHTNIINGIFLISSLDPPPPRNFS